MIDRVKWILQRIDHNSLQISSYLALLPRRVEQTNDLNSSRCQKLFVYLQSIICATTYYIFIDTS